MTSLDGKPRTAPTDLIDVDSPYLTKTQVTAVCVEDPIFDLAIL